MSAGASGYATSARGAEELPVPFLTERPSSALNHHAIQAPSAHATAQKATTKGSEPLADQAPNAPPASIEAIVDNRTMPSSIHLSRPESKEVRVSTVHCLIVTAVAGMAGAAFETTSAAALRANKTTDASVCDLGPNTTELLGRKALVPAAAPAQQAVEAYSRLAGRFIVAACASAQTLILHSDNGRALDVRYLPDLANSLCIAAEVKRTETASPSDVSGESRKGFELRCRIAKFERFRADFEARERAEPTEAFLGRLQAGRK